MQSGRHPSKTMVLPKDRDPRSYLCGHARSDIFAVTRHARTFLASLVFTLFLEWVLAADKEWIKCWSYHGALNIQGQWIDAGNFAYATFWCILSEVELIWPKDENPLAMVPFSNVAMLLRALQVKWPTLDVWHESKHALGMKGDVLECLSLIHI